VTIEFAAGSSAIDSRYDSRLRKIADLVTADPTLQIRIAAHTDNVGTPHANYLFSQKRAQSVKNYLVRKFGVDGRRITAKGYGHYQPVADNATAEGRRKNRRVVTIVLK
jgi:OOP family OmpA-OmpF porin